MNKIKNNFNNTELSFYLRDDVDLSVFNEIFKYREYKSCEEILVSALNPIVDLGAHSGFFSMYVYTFNKGVKIFAIEPEKNNLEFLKLHKQENHINNLKIFETAISSKSEDGELIVSEDSINHVLFKENKNLKIKKESKIQKVKILLLKDFLENNKIKKVSLLKIDIEGGEYDIFENIDSETLNKIQNIIMEYHRVFNKNEKFLENILRQNGFSVSIFPSQFDRTMGFILARNKKTSI